MFASLPAVELVQRLLVEGAQVRDYDRTVLPKVELSENAYQVAYGADALVIGLNARPSPIRLDCRQYTELHRAILQRDCWRCQICGAMSHLEVHHQQFRSHSGQDTEENLITLCHDCHSAEHGE